jgi:hypothetical protein
MKKVVKVLVEGVIGILVTMLFMFMLLVADDEPTNTYKDQQKYISADYNISESELAHLYTETSK